MGQPYKRPKTATKPYLELSQELDSTSPSPHQPNHGPKSALARLATPNDIPALVELAQQARLEMLNYRGGERWLATEAPLEPLEPVFAELLAEPSHTIAVAGIWEGTVVGYAWAQVKPRQDNKLLARIGELFVLADARSVGVGEALYNAVVAWALQHQAYAIQAFVLPGHRHAKNFFETFQMTAHALTMYKELEPPNRSA